MITFPEALALIVYDGRHACTDALKQANVNLACLDALAALAKENPKEPNGSLIFRALRRRNPKLLELYADCYLALDAWVTDWNRSHR